MVGRRDRGVRLASRTAVFGCDVEANGDSQRHYWSCRRLWCAVAGLPLVQISPVLFPLDTFGLRMTIRQRSTVPEVEVAVTAVAVATEVYLIKAKTLHLSTSEVAKFAWMKVAPKCTAKCREELRERIAIELQDWKWWQPDRYASACPCGHYHAKG